MASDFSIWFKKEFGSLPDPEKLSQLADAVISLKKQLKEAEENLRIEQNLHNRFQTELEQRT